MKIVISDNFGRETISERLLISNVTQKEAKVIREAFQRVYGGEDSQVYYRIEKDDYKLYVFEP